MLLSLCHWLLSVDLLNVCFSVLFDLRITNVSWFLSNLNAFNFYKCNDLILSASQDWCIWMMAAPVKLRIILGSNNAEKLTIESGMPTSVEDLAN